MRSHGYDSMPPQQESNKKNTYDSNSSGNFDSYNKHSEVPGYAYSRSISQPPHITLAHALLGLHHRHKAQEEPKSSGTVTTSHCLRPSQASTSRCHLPNRSHSAGQTASHPA